MARSTTRALRPSVLGLAGLGLAGLLLTLAPPAAQAAVGRTAGSADISASGEARYTIPIFAPPGTHGLTPQLALTYGSRGGGDLLLGAGWSVAGLSAIHRCDKTWAQDGVAANVLNSSSDRWPQRQPVEARGGRLWPARRRVPHRDRVLRAHRLLKAAGNGPASFTVEQQDGLLYDYGTSADSQIEAQGQSTIRTWALATIRDRAGNRIAFTYNEDATNGSYQIARVDYTANPGAGLAAAYGIAFVYETQPVGEVESGYAGAR